MEPNQQQTRTKLIAGVIAIIVIAGVIIVADHLKSKSAADTIATPAATSSNTTTPSTSTTSDTTTASGTFTDGTYSASENYQVPPGGENIQVQLTLKDGVVTDASVKNSRNDPESAEFQDDFAAGFKNQVIGKKISGLHVSIIAGASDTAQAFNEAVSQITSKAQA